METGNLGIIGASGLVGRELALQAAAAGWQVCGFSRRPRIGQPGVSEWRTWSDFPDLRGLTALVNLAGEPVNRRWNEANQALFRQSRIGVTDTVCRVLEGIPPSERPAVLVNASAIGVFGDRGDEILEETSTPGTGYLADLCRDWEAAADRAGTLGIRVIKLRVGVVLARDGGSLRQMLPLFRLGLGGRLGSGRQWMPWVHVSDLAASILHTVSGHPISGVVHGTAPEPVTNADFSRTLAKVLKRPAFLPVPPIALRLALGGFASAVLASHRVVPRVLLDSGFRFRHPTLDSALRDLV